MSQIITNDTGCKVSISHLTGDIVCQEPGPDCDCLIVAYQGPEPDPEWLVQAETLPEMF